jgi:GxxExxY protein
MTENEIATEVVDMSYKIHKKLGPGLFESVYEVVLASELLKKGFQVERQVAIPIEYEGNKFDEGFRADIVVDKKVILELKSIESVGNIHKKQLLTYLKLTGMKLGLLINFGEALIKDGLFRIVNGL